MSGFAACFFYLEDFIVSVFLVDLCIVKCINCVLDFIKFEY